MKKFATGLISRYWWIPLVTGLICIGFGIWSLCDPRESLPVLAYVFAGLMCVAGGANLMVAFSNMSYSGWGWSLCLGLLEFIAGIWMLSVPVPELTVMFLYIIGIWILVVAINGVCESCMLISANPVWVVWMILLLFCAIGFSIVLLANPVESIYIEWLWLGISLIAYGVYRVSFSISMRRLGKYTGGLL